MNRQDKKRLSDLKEVTKIQCSSGNWNYDPYMFGMANGMILVVALMEGRKPEFLSAPKKWLKDRKTRRKPVAVSRRRPT